ncbi:MAG: acetylornithine deacetylase [Pseudomonadota bacterium]
MSRELELLERLVAFPTISDQSNLDLIDWAQNLLQEAGFHTTRIPASDPKKAGLHAIVGPRQSGGICLSAHTDVVPVKGQNWTRAPFSLTREGPHVYGRGTTDMKGFLACALAAAERMKNHEIQRPLSLLLSYDEEIGCVGLSEMLPHLRGLLAEPELVLVGEPTSMQIATGHKGKTAYKVTCRGEAGHSALSPLFVNAIHLAARFVEEIRALQSELSACKGDRSYKIPYSTVHIGRINGGRALNIVPDLVSLDMEVRHLAQTAASDVFEKLSTAAERVCAAEGCTDAIKIEPAASYPGLDHDPKSSSVALLRAATGGSSTTKVPFGTEAGFFAELGLNAVVVGPGDMAAHGHKPDEKIAIGEIESCADMLDKLLLHLTN